MAIYTQQEARGMAAQLAALKSKQELTPESIKTAALAAGHSRQVADDLAALPAATSAKLETIKRTHREKSAQLDQLRAEVNSLRAKKATADKPAPASTISAAAFIAVLAKPTMTRAEFRNLPPREQGLAIKQVRLVD